MTSVPGKVLDELNSRSDSLKRTLSAKTTSFRAIFDESYERLMNLNFGGPLSSSRPIEEEPKAAAQSPDEYRNLLLSLSGAQIDHILWMRSLRELHWRGDCQFAFELDKCGVPTLKSGGYKINLCYECLDLPLKESSTDPVDSPKLKWEASSTPNGLSLPPASVELSMRDDLLPMVEKCARMMRQFEVGAAKGEFSVLVYLPCVPQLVVSVLAAARIGATLTYVNSATNADPNDLAELIQLSGAQLLITLDGFVQNDGTLFWAKQILDEAIEKLESTKGIPMKPDRDFLWSELMLRLSQDEELGICFEEDRVEWMDSECPLFSTIRKTESAEGDENGGEQRWLLQSYSVGQIALIVQLLAAKFEQSAENGGNGAQIGERKHTTSLYNIKQEDHLSARETDEIRRGSTKSESHTLGVELATLPRILVPAQSGVIWPLVANEDMLFLCSMFAVPKSRSSLIMSLYAPVQIFDLAKKHSVSQLLVAQEYIKQLSESEQIGPPSLGTIYAVSRSKDKSELEVAGGELKKCAPNAQIEHLFC